MAFSALPPDWSVRQGKRMKLNVYISNSRSHLSYTCSQLMCFLCCLFFIIFTGGFNQEGQDSLSYPSGFVLQREQVVSTLWGLKDKETFTVCALLFWKSNNSFAVAHMVKIIYNQKHLHKNYTETLSLDLNSITLYKFHMTVRKFSVAIFCSGGKFC